MFAASVLYLFHVASSFGRVLIVLACIVVVYSLVM